ncbi:polyketide cyclase [Parvibaculum sedimenti]|uniref:Polyketide cyclase n=1 Tax=Parvibaculum sedimenti TaxID=2608632 RepID=A0A6N6VGA8_9HYPH|nr:SRPBCC family protein [Parvibaculum sedimenti]KAB7739700.1 polyketide cyclase [Parvibaculum sedimenti]
MSTSPVRIARTFPTLRETVFKAWSSTDHVKRWFAPSGFTIPHAKVQMHVGGPFEVCMRGPDGTDYWTRGTFTEVSPVDRLVLDLYAEDLSGHRLFRARTEVTFADAVGGTHMEVVQSYTVLDPNAAPMIEGAPVGWNQTLERLEAEIARMDGKAEAPRSVVHSMFHLERTYDAPIHRVFEAFSTEAGKSRWFGGEAGQWESLERHMDFRVGGTERASGRWQGGVVSTFDAIYHDIIPMERIVYTYEMHLDDKKISVSLATIQFKRVNDGRTTLKITEQGAFLDGYDDAGSREEGTAGLLDRLAASLKR